MKAARCSGGVGGRQRLAVDVWAVVMVTRVAHLSPRVRVSVGAAVKVLKLRHRLARTRCTLIFPLYLTCSLFIVVVSRLRGISACKYFVLDTKQYYIRIGDVYVSAKEYN